MDAYMGFPYSYLKLANHFAANFLTLVPGEYQSEDKRYKFVLCDDIKNQNGTVSRTVARIEMRNFCIEVNKSANINQPSDYMFFLLLWFYAKYHQTHNPDQEEYKSDSDTDIEVLNYCISVGRSKESIYKGFLDVSNYYSNERMLRRCQELKKYVDNL